MYHVIESAMPDMHNRNYLQIILKTLELAIPSTYLWLVIFYGLFHAYLNFWAELTRFADRRFYLDWWNAGNLGEFWRKWNFPIHAFLNRHVYYPLRRRNVNSQVAILCAFMTSAVFHEYLMVGVLGTVNGIAFTLMVINVPIMIMQRQLKGTLGENTNNILYWLLYSVIGQPFAIIFCFYQAKKD
jgi:diacylglycerol O-acyltransferase-1